MVHSALSDIDTDCPDHIFYVSFHAVFLYALPSVPTAGLGAVRKEMDLGSNCSF